MGIKMLVAKAEEKKSRKVTKEFWGTPTELR